MTFDNSRTEKLIGRDAVRRLAGAHAAVFGAGGVGGYVCEALIRAGIGSLTVIDGDNVAPSNLNRQIIATAETIGMPKVEAVAMRAASINPGCRVFPVRMFYLPGESGIDFSRFDIIADCVDTVAAKIGIAKAAEESGIPLISSMGAGKKLHPELFRISDVFSTHGDPLARAVRKGLREAGISSLPCVWSDEPPFERGEAETDGDGEKDSVATAGKASPPGSISFVPAAAGLIMAGWMIRRLCSSRDGRY